MNKVSGIHSIISLIIISFLLSACGGGGSGSASSNTNTVETTVETNTPSTKNINLSWTAPTSYEDDTFLPLSEISGYRIYTGVSIDSMSFTADVSNPGSITYRLSNISADMKFIAISTYDINGIESQKSVPVSI